MTERRLPDTDIYGVTDRGLSRGRSNREVVQAMLDAGVEIIQYREKELTTRQKYAECREIRELCAARKACFIVNDDIELALAVAADGIHIGQDDLPAEKTRELVGEEMIIGLSTITREQADEAEAAGVADYLGVGPVYDTATKKDAAAAVGLEYLDYVVRHCRTPVVAIGGIKESNAAEVVKHGVNCAAIISDIVGAEDIGEKIRAIRQRMAEARKRG